MTKDEITAILAECRAHWGEHGTSVPDAALKALEDVLQGLDAAPRLDFITTAGHDAARIFAELQAHRSRGMTAATLQDEADRLAAKWARYLAHIEGEYLAEERTYRVTIERDAEGNETTTTPPNPYADLLGITRLSSAVKTAAAQAAAGEQDVLPKQPDAPKQWMLGCFYNYLQGHYPHSDIHPTPFSTEETKTAAYAKIGEKWGYSPNNVKNNMEKTITPEQRQPLLQGGLQTGRTKELLEMLAPYPKALAQCRKEAGLTDDKAKP